MYTVKKIPETPNIIWDGKGKKPLCRFVKGVLTTDDETLAEKLKGMGYEVLDDTPKTKRK